MKEVVREVLFCIYQLPPPTTPYTGGVDYQAVSPPVEGGVRGGSSSKVNFSDNLIQIRLEEWRFDNNKELPLGSVVFKKRSLNCKYY